MASVTIPLKRFETGDLPSFCAVSGVSAANVYAIRAGDRKLMLPLHGDVIRSLARVQLACKVAFVAALGIFIVGLAARNSLVLELASVPFAIGLGLLWAASSRMPRARILGDKVRLDRVNEGFVQSLSSTPGKCAGCTSNGECSVAAMDACDTDGHTHASSETGDRDSTLVSGT